jgi:hypothetical protein
MGWVEAARQFRTDIAFTLTAGLLRARGTTRSCCGISQGGTSRSALMRVLVSGVARLRGRPIDACLSFAILLASGRAHHAARDRDG